MLGAFGDIEWKRRFDRVYNDGLQRIDTIYIITKIMLPIAIYLLDFLVFPYFLSRVLIMITGTTSYSISTLCTRYSFALYVILRTLWYVLVVLYGILVRLHNEIRDSRYLLGTELANR